MKKTLLLSALFFLLCFWNGNSQSYTQDFEGGLPASWTTFKLLNGTVSTAPFVPGWAASNTGSNACQTQGTTSAFATSTVLQNLNDQSQSWLVSEAITIPANASYNLYFDSKRVYNNNTYPTRFKVKISTTSATDITTFTDVLDYGLTDLTPWGYNVCYPHGSETPIVLPTYATNTQIYIAFVKEDVQDAAGSRNDRWVLDNVRVVEQCLPPVNANSVVQSETATLTWGGSATSNYEVAIIQGNGMPNDFIVDYTPNTNSVEVTGLTASTTYTYYIRKICADNESAWAGPFTMTTGNCGAATQCVYTFTALDEWGDGWNSNTMSVMQNGVLVQTITLTSGSSATYQVALCSGMPFQLIWNTGGSFPDEVGIDVTNGFGDTIFQMPFESSNLRGSTIFTDIVNCTPPTCPRPINLAATSPTDSTVILSWTETGSATQWEVIAVPTGSPIPGANPTNSQIATTIPYTYTGLNSGTDYQFYVRAICSGTDISDWRGVGSFTTQPNYCTGSHFYDSGGPNGNYTGGSTAASGTTVICNPNDLGALLVTFNSFDTEPNWDVLRVYDGNSSASPLIGTFSGNNIPNSFASSGACLTFVFTSDTSVNRAGWDISILCISLTCPAPTNVLATTTEGSSSVALSWTPGGSETQWELFIQEEGTGYPTGNTPGVIVNNTPAYNFVADDNTFYEYYVRAVCSDSDASYWVGPIRFNIFRPPGCAEVDVVGVGVEIVDNRITVCPDGDTNVGLSASFFGIASTTSYAVEPIPFQPPFPATGGTALNISTDDIWSPVQQLPFNFCFFGESYNSAIIGSNGVVSFTTSGTNHTPGGTCPWSYDDSIPDPGMPIRNAIYGVYQDINPVASVSPNADINYAVLGTYPCRALVVNYNNVNQYSCGASTGPQISQIVIYEISNIIEVYVQRRVACTSWNGGRGVIGIQNATGTQGYTPPGRNTGTWSATNEAWRFTPNGASDVDFSWTKDGVFLTDQTDVTFSLTPEEVEVLQQQGSLVVEMVATATYETCDEDESYTLSKQIDVTFIYNFPSTEPEDLHNCSADLPVLFDLTENTDHILQDVPNPNIFEFTYYASEADAESGDLSLAIVNPESYPGSDGEQIWVRISDLTNQCHEVRTFFLYHGEVTNSQATFEYGATTYCINGANPTPSLMDGTTTGGEFTASAPELVIDPLTGTIDLTASTEGTYTVTYTVDSVGCVLGSSATFDVTLVNENLVTAFGYPQATYCQNDLTGLVLPVLDTDFSVGGVFSSTTGISIDSATGEITLATSQPGVYTVTYTFEGSCTIYTSTATIEVIEAEIPVVEFSYDANQYCSNAANPVLIPSSGFVQGGVFSSSDSGLSIDATTGAIDLASTALGTYDITYTVSATACVPETAYTVTIMVGDSIDPITTFSYSSLNYCTSEGTIVPILDPLFFNGGIFTSAQGLVLDSATGVIDASASTPGVYTVTYTVNQDDATCNIGGEFSTSVTINGDFAVNLNEECIGNAYWLHATSVDGSYNESTAQYIWVIDGVQVNSNAASINVSELGLDIDVDGVDVTVTVIDGCEGVAGFTVTSTACMIQKGISPNNDGLNDYFDLTGMGARKLSIYNRYGREVYSKGNYVKEWKGQDNNDNELPTGTYFYAIERSNGNNITGWIYINRNN